MNTNNTTNFLLTRIVGSKFLKPEEGGILLNEHKTYFCGSTPDNDIVCQSERVSQKHCIFFCYPDDIHIQDLNSKFGIYLNGKKVKRYEVVKLKNNDIIGIGANNSQSDDLSQFIYRLQTVVQPRIVLDIERDFSKSKHHLDYEENHPHSKKLKQSCEGDLLSSTESSDVDCEEVRQTEAKIDEIILHIVAWDPEDFLMNNDGKLNPSIRKNINFDKTSKFYETYEEYNKVQTLNILLQVAYKIQNAITTHKETKLEEWEVVKNSGTKILLTGTNSYVLNFDLCITVSKPTTVAIGDLFRLGIVNDGNKFCTTIFGFIRYLKTTNSQNKNKTTIICTVMTKFLDIKIYTSKILDLRLITNLNFALNLAKALIEFKSAPLLPLIIKPTLENYSLPHISNPKIVLPHNCSELLLHTNYINSKQFDAVMRMNKVIVSEAPTIHLIEGSAGTGKTKIIIDIILTVFENVRLNNGLPLKILINARSKIELEEIIHRVASIKKDLDSIKLVYTEHSEITNPQVKDYSLKFLAKNHVELGIRELVLLKETSVESNNQPNVLDVEYSELKIYSHVVRTYILETCYKHLNCEKMLDVIDENEIPQLLEYAEKTLLQEANVILTTLPMCSSNLMNSVFNEKEEIRICIIDNAAEIPEIDLLKPLTFGVKKLILLGDQYKVLGNTDCKLEKIGTWDNTLFSRIKANFDELQTNPIIKLDLQFRINHELMNWMNEILFDGNLKTCFQKNTFPVFPYRVFHLQPNYTNEDEATFVANLIFVIVEFSNLAGWIKPMKIGVIVNEISMKLGIISTINRSLINTSSRRKEFFSIHVDVISEFKNQESNVVIFSGTKEIQKQHVSVKDEWLYKALTRVKNSLIIYGSFKKLMDPSLLKSVTEVAKKERIYSCVDANINSLVLKNYLIRNSNIDNKITVL